MTAYLTREHFPTQPETRFFEVKHNPKSVRTPVTIELREYASDRAAENKATSLSRLLGIEYATADRDDIVEAAKRLDSRVGRIDDVVGVY